ncbi:hypothetical protein R1sor_020742 [Riccia sorocarpa]|uniref:DEP domain-containing protein n=1 Tax=Riccia sorocarpa TaxID=122646 RepID=A0ABD3GIQ2_9MARC
MVSNTQVPADATASTDGATDTNASENVTTTPPTNVHNKGNDDPVQQKGDEQAAAEGQSAPTASSPADTASEAAGDESAPKEKAIILNEELLDGPYRVRTISVDPKNGNSETDSGGELHPASESGRRLGFPVEEWTEKASAQASALRNLVLDGGNAMSKALRRLSGKREDFESLEHTDEKSDKSSLEAVKEEHKERALPASGGTPPGEHKERQLKEKVTRWLAQKKNEIVGQVVDSYPSEKDSSSAPREAEEPKEVVDPGPQLKGRITVYTISGSQNCRAAKHFLRSRKLPFVEINLDAFPERRLDLEARTEKSSVPQIFFNNVFVGGFPELSAMDSDELEKLIKDVYEVEVPADAPAVPVYGEDSPDEESRKLDEYAEIVRRLRKAVVVKDRFLRYRVHSNCFVGSEAIDFLVEDQYCEREEAVELARNFAKKHFIHPVNEDHLFEDGSYLYRFLENEPAVVGNKVLNFNGATNDLEPLPAVDVGNKLRQLMLAILESKLSSDGKHVDHHRLAKSEEFRRYVKLTEELHRINLLTLSREEKLAFYINLYNSLVIHAVVHLGYFPVGALERRKFFGDFQYLVGGYCFSLSAIQNGLLRANQRAPYTLTKPFGPRDNRVKAALTEPEALVHFALARGPQSSPAIKCYSAGRIDEELKSAASEFFADGGIQIDTGAKNVSLDRIFKGYSTDFGRSEVEILKWILPYLDTKKSEQLTKLLDDTGLKVTYLS